MAMTVWNNRGIIYINSAILSALSNPTLVEMLCLEEYLVFTN